MILGTKGLDEQHPLSAPELKELFLGGDNLAKAGFAAGAPAAVPQGQLLRIIATIKRYHDVCLRLTEAQQKQAEEENGEDFVTPVIADMVALINVGPPVPEHKKSRVILPG